MKNHLQVDLDTERERSVVISKPARYKPPENEEELAEAIALDMATLCEALCTLIHVAEQNGVKSSADSLRACISHLEQGFGDASYIGKVL